MAGTHLPTWSEIRESAEAGGFDMSLWENQLPGRLTEYIVNHTKARERYLTDAVFHAELDRLVGLVIGCLMEHSPLVDPLLRMRAADFDKLFQLGAQEGRP